MATSEITPSASLPQLRAALYCRVSTKDKGQDYTNQLNQLREFAARHGWTIVVEFCDTVSGGTSERVEFQRMFQAASKHEFDVYCSGAWTGFHAKALSKPCSTYSG